MILLDRSNSYINMLPSERAEEYIILSQGINVPSKVPKLLLKWNFNLIESSLLNRASLAAAAVAQLVKNLFT